MQKIILLMAVLFSGYTIYALIMAYCATHIGKTRPMYHTKLERGWEIREPFSDSSFASNFKEFFLPGFMQSFMRH